MDKMNTVVRQIFEQMKATPKRAKSDYAKSAAELNRSAIVAQEKPASKKKRA